MTIHLMIRGFAGGELKFEDRVDIPESDLERLIPQLAEKHAAAMAAERLHMIEIEFLDEPHIFQRFVRFGTDPRRMIAPLKIDLKGGGE